MLLSPIASSPSLSKGRLYQEPDLPFINNFQKDRNRIIRSNAFKRLQYKTQVFINTLEDHYKNRLTHSLEVSVIASTIAIALKVSVELAEAIALAHDLGHPPFGHIGERILSDLMLEFGGFNHNDYAIKLITSLEKSYATFNGLNLCWEVLEGIAKHNGPFKEQIPREIALYDKIQNLDLRHASSIEAQIASVSDDIAYNCHDLEDAVRSDLCKIDDLSEVDLLQDYLINIKTSSSYISKERLTHEVTRKLQHYLIQDVISTTKNNLERYEVETSLDVRLFQKNLVEFSNEAKNHLEKVRRFLYIRMYRNPSVIAVEKHCKAVLQGLFKAYMSNINLIPSEWKSKIEINNMTSCARVVADYIAGMTDRYAIREYESIYGLQSKKL